MPEQPHPEPEQPHPESEQPRPEPEQPRPESEQPRPEPEQPRPEPVEGHTTFPYRYAEQNTPPPAERVSEVAITTFEHVFEVDPRLMERWVLQQTFPNWDSLRLMNSRHDHLEWMHRHFAERVITGSELLAEVDPARGTSTDE